MSRQAEVDRFVALVCRELGCTDAHFELGGEGPNTPTSVTVELDAGWRLVAMFAAAPADPEAVEQRLRAIAESFDETLSELPHSAPVPASAASVAASSELTRILDLLCDRTEATTALVIDIQTPVLWGSSTSGTWVFDVERLCGIGLAVDRALHAQGDILGWVRGNTAFPGELAQADALTLRELLADRTDAAARLNVLCGLPEARGAAPARIIRRSGGTSMFRAFAGIYRLVLSFADGFSELHAQTAISRALPIVERLVDGLPPRDPAPKGSRVVQLHPL